jgi:hypothetical protein
LLPGGFQREKTMMIDIETDGDEEGSGLSRSSACHRKNTTIPWSSGHHAPKVLGFFIELLC